METRTTRPATLRPFSDEGALNLKEVVQLFERTLIHATLAACDWNQRKASETLGVLQTTLSEKIRRYDLRPPGVRRPAPTDINMVSFVPTASSLKRRVEGPGARP